MVWGRMREGAYQELPHKPAIPSFNNDHHNNGNFYYKGPQVSSIQKKTRVNSQRRRKKKKYQGSAEVVQGLKGFIALVLIYDEVIEDSRRQSHPLLEGAKADLCSAL